MTIIGQTHGAAMKKEPYVKSNIVLSLTLHVDNLSLKPQFTPLSYW